MRCIIIDDEPFARKGIQGYVEKVDFLQLAGVCEHALELNSLLKKQPADLLFLDIEMPYLSGVEFLKQLVQRPMVIFTTAYEQYALQGFELDVVDYLLKPISFERFFKAVNKAYDQFQLQHPLQNDHLFVKIDDKLVKITFDTILYLEALENYVTIHTVEGKHLVHYTLKGILAQLPQKQFVQSHKSYVININQVQQIEGNRLFIDKFQVPVSKNLREEVLYKIVNNRLLKK